MTAGLVSLFLLLSSAAQAQVPTLPSQPAGDSVTELPEPLTKDAINEMVARMSDDQVRSFLIERLDAVAAEQTTSSEPVSFVDRMTQLWGAFITPSTQAFQKLPILFVRQGDAMANFAQTYGGLGGVLTMLGLTALVLAIGFGAEMIFRQATKKWQELAVSGEEQSLGDAVRFLFRRFLAEIMGLVVFYVVIQTVGRLVLTAEQIQFAGPLVGYLIWMPRLGAAVSRFIMAPKRPDLRLVNADDHWASFIHRNTIGLVLLGGFTIFAVTFNASNGIALGETRLGFWLDSAVYIYIIAVAWIAREGLSDMMRGTDPDRTPYDERVAELYPYFAMVVAAGMWVVVSTMSGLGKLTQILQGAHYVTMFWLLMAPALDTAIRGLVRHLVPPMIGEGPIAEEAYRSTKRSYIRIGRVLVAGLVLMIIGNAWDVDLFSASADAVGIGDNIISFLMTLAVGYIVYEGVSLWVNRRLAKEQTTLAVTEEEMGGEGGGSGGSRLATVLPLVLVTCQIATGIIFGLLAIGNLGIDITPLLAGAGILGLAIGFGAQKLVADIVGGIFFLVDDAFRVGEYVDVGGTTGTVEKISIRSMQLRHHRGPVHTIPYGEIQKLTNFSRDWVIMKLKFTVPFDTDPNKVKKLFKKIGAAMVEDPLYKDDFLQPFKSQGVFDFDDVGMIIRGKFMAKPGTQFTLRKEIYNRVKAAFNENGIEFARREVRVAIPGLDETEHLSDAEKQAVAAAASGAVQQQIQKNEGESG
ncbi:MAG: mechanosensitive ion channel [Rhodobacteraceae bacterium]|nr:mechanosensitive ion channel [Paracoccaceae bacterium]